MKPSETTYLLGIVRLHLDRLAKGSLLTRSERSYLADTEARLGAMQGRLEELERGATSLTDDPLPIGRGARRYSRKEAAELVGVHPNSLLNWESRGLITPRRDWRGWRSYGGEELAAAMSLAAHRTRTEQGEGGKRREDETRSRR